MLFSLLNNGFKCLTLSLCILMFTMNDSGAQVLEDPPTLTLVKKAVDQIYNMHFTEASETCSKISSKYPEHPIVFLLTGMTIYWENYPLMSRTKAGQTFEEQMRTCIDKSENFKPENEAEYLLTNLCARGSLLDYYSDNELTSKVFSLGSTTYKYIRRSFKFTGTFPDFYFFTGLYNYYREAYPEAHPVYKPLFIILPRGDRKKGMNELRTALRESIFMKAEASTFLSSNYKYFEKDFDSATYFSQALFNKYSRNTAFLIDCIEDLLLTGKYDEAEKLILSPASRTNNRYYQAQLIILRGILNEKKYKDAEQARQEYSIGVENIKEYGDYGKQYAAYAYFGLSRINSNNSHDQKIYRRKAVELADFADINFDNIE